LFGQAGRERPVRMLPSPGESYDRMMPSVWLIGDRDARYLTHRALDEAISTFPDSVSGVWVATDSPNARRTEVADAVWVVPGTPYRDVNAVLEAIRHARENGQPLLATCGGFQHVVLEFARNVLGWDAGHAESDPDHEQTVVEALACGLVGERRSVNVVPDTRLSEICGSLRGLPLV
jgi:CTP synthase (UTP-ammonia lyase)